MRRSRWEPLGYSCVSCHRVRERCGVCGCASPLHAPLVPAPPVSTCQSPVASVCAARGSSFAKRAGFFRNETKGTKCREINETKSKQDLITLLWPSSLTIIISRRSSFVVRARLPIGHHEVHESINKAIFNVITCMWHVHSFIAKKVQVI